MMNIFADLGKLLSLKPSDDVVQTKVAELRAYITEHFYNCTPEILYELGQMYAGGGSMTDNINKAGGAGTAEFASKAIEFYCKKLGKEMRVVPANKKTGGIDVQEVIKYVDKDNYYGVLSISIVCLQLAIVVKLVATGRNVRTTL